MKSVCILIVVFVSLNAFGIQCSDYDIATGPFPYHQSGIAGHSSGSHSWSVIFTGSVFYTAPLATGLPCRIHASMIVQASASDTGSIQFPYMDHSIKWNSKSGDVLSNGPGISADGEAAVDVIPCFFTGCGIAPTISGSGNGAGFSVSFPSSQIWTDQKYLKVVGIGPVYASVPACRPNQCCDQVTSGIANPISVCGPSPIVVSLVHGLDATKAFTDPTKACVTFNLKNDGKPLCYSWPKRGSGVAFLVYDRDNDGGLIDSGDEMFGDHTPHSDCYANLGLKPAPGMRSVKTGYCALAWYDQTGQGGNLDMEITKDDKIWSKLRLWTPDHCWDNPDIPCESIPSEIHSLAEYGITSIGIAYQVSGLHDKWGNAFRFYGQLNPSSTRPQAPSLAIQERRSWDVFLKPRP